MPTRTQREFFSRLKARSKLTWSALAKQCGVSERTLRDWARAKYTPSQEAVSYLSTRFTVPRPSRTVLLERYWYIKHYARRGALARLRLFGPPGNQASRRKGGIISQQRRRERPQYYRLLGCNVRKEVPRLTPSQGLAELFGIILGDGGITDYQVRITLDAKVDKKYVPFVARLMLSFFHEKPSISRRKNVINITISGAGVVEALEKLGLKRGNKVKHQVAIPSWIIDHQAYARACVRGLMDTDGCVFFHRHRTKGIPYVHCGLTLTNNSRAILDGVLTILKIDHFSPSVAGGNKLYLYNFEEVKRYFELVGTSNPKHLLRFHKHLRRTKK